MHSLLVVRAPFLWCVVGVSTTALAQQQPVPIRPVSAPTAVATELRSVDELREVANGKVLINSSRERKLLLFDASLKNPSVLADTMDGAAARYPRGGKLIPFLGDSTLFVEYETRSLVMIDPDGKFGRVMAPPMSRPQDFNGLTGGSPVGVDARGRIVYQGQRPFASRPTCRTDGLTVAPAPPAVDSVYLLRADFDTRAVDTIGRSRITLVLATFPKTVNDANCRVISASMRIDPSVPSVDAWTVTSRGDVAIIRGHDYHVDWIKTDGTKRTSAKLPFDWRRLTDADKQAKIDSARRIVDSLTAAGGYRLQACAGGRSLSFNPGPVPGDGSGSGRGGSSGGAGGGGSAGGGGGIAGVGRGGAAPGAPGLSPDGPGPSDCQTVTVAAQFAPVDSMADYIAPLREFVPLRADLDGNVWTLPTTTARSTGGLLYDVVGPDGELRERVQLPPDRVIAGFGKDGVLYLSHASASGGVVLERVKIGR
jgi:hypothetical protein